MLNNLLLIYVALSEMIFIFFFQSQTVTVTVILFSLLGIAYSYQRSPLYVR